MTPVRFCGRDFSSNDLELIRTIIAADDRPNRAEISRRVCRDISPRPFLYEYFEAVAHHDGRADGIVSEFLPWDLPPQRRERLLNKAEILDSS